jgi:LacI family transcriptional regulator
VALSEPLALGAIAGIRDLGLNLGPDLSFAAFDDFPLAAHWSPRITVVRQNVEALALETVALLLARIESPGKPFDNVRVQADLKWRESVVGA